MESSETTQVEKFQSPQWGSNSKVSTKKLNKKELKFQSPQWGSNSKVAI